MQLTFNDSEVEMLITAVQSTLRFWREQDPCRLQEEQLDSWANLYDKLLKQVECGD